MEELEKVPKELKGTSTPELLTLAAYVSKDGLLGHHCKERPIGLANFICPRAKKGEWVGMGELWDSIENVNEEST